MMKRILLPIIAALALAGQAFAATATSDLNVSMSLGAPASATVSVEAMNFGTTSGSTHWLYTNSIVTVNASNGLPYNVSINKGSYYYSGIRYACRASSTAYCKEYYLYKDSALTQYWGDSDFANTYSAGSSLAGTGTGSNQALTVYGQIYGLDLTGTFTDTVIVTVNY